MNYKTLLTFFLFGTTALAQTAIEFSYPKDIVESDVTCSELTQDIRIECTNDLENRNASCYTLVIFNGTKVSRISYGHLYQITSRSSDAYTASKALQNELSKLYSGSNFKHPKCSGDSKDVNSLASVQINIRNKKLNSEEVNYDLTQSISKVKLTSDELCLSEISMTSCFSGKSNASEVSKVYTSCSNDLIYRNKADNIFSESINTSYSISEPTIAGSGAPAIIGTIVTGGATNVAFNAIAGAATKNSALDLQKKFVESQSSRLELQSIKRCDQFTDRSGTFQSHDNIPLK